MPGQQTLVLCAHTIANLQRTARLIQQAPAGTPKPCKPLDLTSRLTPGPTEEESDR